MSPVRVPAAGVSVDEATLFAFDDVANPFTHNLRLGMHSPRKHPANPVLARGEPGTPDEFGVQFYGPILRDEGRFRMWYVAVDPGITSSANYTTSLRQAYAESAAPRRYGRDQWLVQKAKKISSLKATFTTWPWSANST